MTHQGFLFTQVCPSNVAFSPLTGARNIQISLSALLVSGCLTIHSCFFLKIPFNSLVLICSN